ncbi:hypothetical protein P154DRAFT_522084 [Amniculicola lignicola CBS 123094]|uniref:Uncharacterized protein n=1 Tax=Amniculicola lignicola CBS 123094 TaxID=1392246 RepID=A0A6A5WLS6_9PLEO|nr:hypothetical protein P154DRAFT_522084 [Amniculicola lignicola CBS 123094]
MDPAWQELQRMAEASSAADAQVADEYPTPETISRWKKLFGYSQMEAVSLITQQRQDLARDRISDEHWELIKEQKEASGYDRETYEHSLRFESVLKSQSASIPSAEGGFTFVFRLGGLLNSPEKVKEICGMNKAPKIVDGMGETGKAQFCVVGEEAKAKIEEWLKQQRI